MDRRTTAIVATAVTAMLCGFPGLVLCLFGGFIALGGGPMSLDETYQPINPAAGIGLLCLSLILMAIPIIVAVVTFRRKPDVVAPVVPPVSGPMPPVTPEEEDADEPLPPAS